MTPCLRHLNIIYIISVPRERENAATKLFALYIYNNATRVNCTLYCVDIMKSKFQYIYMRVYRRRLPFFFSNLCFFSSYITITFNFPGRYIFPSETSSPNQRGATDVIGNCSHGLFSSADSISSFTPTRLHVGIHVCVYAYSINVSYLRVLCVCVTTNIVRLYTIQIQLQTVIIIIPIYIILYILLL